ncbi:MAG: hypothetical protein J6A83_01665 [Clostridia bacterium]|nr:hypothetical protein [Clostridia bacterium]
MKSARLIAFENVNGITSIQDLKALDAYYESPFCEFDEKLSNNKIFEILKERYSLNFSNMYNPNFKIQFK